MYKFLVLNFVVLLGLALPAAAATVNIVTQEGVAQVSQFGIRSNTSSYGGDLGGAVIKAAYADGTTEEIIWNATSKYLGAAIGTDLTLERTWRGTETEQRFYLNTTKLLATLTIDLVGASSIFDISWGATTGAYYGYPFTIYDGADLLDGEVTATYSNIFGIAGEDFHGETFTALTLDFSAVAARGLLGELKFDSDIDTLAVAGDLAPVPLSPSMPFLAFGAVALCAFRRKRQKSLLA